MSDEKQLAVYIIANRYRGTIYIGVTARLYDRVLEHKDGSSGGFAAKYKLKKLVWYAHYPDMAAAIKRETQMKVWKRDWKFELIDKMNPDWLDLHERIEYRSSGE